MRHDRLIQTETRRSSRAQTARGILLAGLVTICPINGQAQRVLCDGFEAPGLWTGAYLASWNHFAPPGGNWGNLPTDAIDWSRFTHMMYFAFRVHADGTLAEPAPFQNLNADRLEAIVPAAHANGKPILFSVGGYGNHTEFSAAIEPARRATFIANLIDVMDEWGFDGIDLDMEPIYDADRANYAAFVTDLAAALQTMQTPLLERPLLTAAVGWQPALFASLQQHFDQINLMTYDFSGAWPGWITWHNAAVTSGGLTFPSTGALVPSAERMVDEFVAAGVDPTKLGIGVDFYGYIWAGGHGTATGGVTEPAQSWTDPPTVTANVPYHELMADYFTPSAYRWDANAEAAYLSLDAPADADDRFISYDDRQSIDAKAAFARNAGLGGLIVWELGGGYRAALPDGERDRLLQAVGEAVSVDAACD